MPVNPGTAENLRNRGRFDENRSQHQDGDQGEQEDSKGLNSITQMGDKKAQRNRPGEKCKGLSQVGQRKAPFLHRTVDEKSRVQNKTHTHGNNRDPMEDLILFGHKGCHAVEKPQHVEAKS